MGHYQKEVWNYPYNYPYNSTVSYSRGVIPNYINTLISNEKTGKTLPGLWQTPAR